MINDLGRVSRAELLSEQVYKEMKQAVMNGRFPPGQKLAIRGLAESVGTSPTPVREALVRLVAEQALEIGPNRKVQIPTISLNKLAEINQIRMALEGMATENAARHFDAGLAPVLFNVRRQIEAFSSFADSEAKTAAKAEFFFAIYQASQMPTLTTMIEGLWVQIGPYLNLVHAHSSSNGSKAFPYTRLVELLLQRNAEGARQMVVERIREECAQMLKFGRNEKTAIVA